MCGSCFCRNQQNDKGPWAPNNKGGPLSISLLLFFFGGGGWGWGVRTNLELHFRELFFDISHQTRYVKSSSSKSADFLRGYVVVPRLKCF